MPSPCKGGAYHSQRVWAAPFILTLARGRWLLKWDKQVSTCFERHRMAAAPEDTDFFQA